MLLRVKIFGDNGYEIPSARALAADHWGQPGARGLEDSGYKCIALGRTLALVGSAVRRTARGTEGLWGGDG